ncbi:hypothetical protein Tco_1452673, partial [Tanacetum coccineum]
NMKMEPDIENMTINEYLEYEAAKVKRLWDDVRSRRSPTSYNEADVDSFHRNKRGLDGDDGDTFDIWDIMVEDVKRIRNFFNVPDEIDRVVKPLIPEPIHTTPPNDDYVDRDITSPGRFSLQGDEIQDLHDSFNVVNW